MIDIFISHSQRDASIAESLIALLRSALSVPAETIRCTSVDGYRLPAGVSTEERLRQEVHDAKAFIGIITQDSLRSAYVLFELGARWGAGRQLVPLLAAGTPATALVGPLSGLNALDCRSSAQLHQLVSDIAQELKLSVGNPASYLRAVEDLRKASELRSIADSPLVMMIEPFITGHMRSEDGRVSRAMVTIPVTVINESNRTITPEYFQLSILVDGKPVSFIQTRIPPGVEFASELQDIKIPSAHERDLTGHMGSLLPGQALTGLLMFSSDAVSWESLQQQEKSKGLPLLVSCVDIRGLFHSVALVDKPSNVPGASVKMGLTVAPKPQA